MPRVLGVDFGAARVGLAVSDPLGHTAQPLEVVNRSKNQSMVDAVLKVATDLDVVEIVVGLPLKLDGTSGVAADAARSFADALKERGKIPVVLWDERLSTVQASRDLRSAGLASKRQKGVVDKVAAAVVLGSYLQSKTPSPDIEDMVLPESYEAPSREGSRVRGGAGKPSLRKRSRAPRNWRDDSEEY